MPSNLAFLPNLGPPEIIIILVIALIFFGGRLPEVGRSLGRGIVEFKRGLRGLQDEVDQAADDKKNPAVTDKKPEKDDQA